MSTGQQVSKVCLQLFIFFRSNSYFPLRLIIDFPHSQNSTHFFLNPQSSRGLAVGGGGGRGVVVVVDGVVDVVVDVVVVGGVGVVHSIWSPNELSNINRISVQILSRVVLSIDGKTSFNFCLISFVIVSGEGRLEPARFKTSAFAISSVVVSLSTIFIISSFSSMVLCAPVRPM